jgi:hypothetical protein
MVDSFYSTTSQFAALHNPELNSISVTKQVVAPLPRHYSDPSTLLRHFLHNVDNRNFLIHNGSVVDAEFLKPSTNTTTRVNQNKPQSTEQIMESADNEKEEIQNFLKECGLKF